MKDNKKVAENEDRELKAKMEKELSPTRAILRIVIGIIAIIIWLAIGVNITILFSSAIQQTMGFTQYFVRNPIYFLIVAFINIILGLYVYFFVGIVWWAVIHLIWSIRWFYGFIRYRKVK